MEPLTGEILNINNKYATYQEYKAATDNVFQKASENFVLIGYQLKVARDTDILSESGYKNVNEFAQAEYGLDKSQVSRFIRINDEYSEGGYSDKLQGKYRQFGYTKLALMLTLPGVVADEITANFSKTEIQDIKEEVEAEQKISDLEVMMEEQNRQQAEYGIVGKVLYQLGHDEPELHMKLYDAVMKTEWDEDTGIDLVVNALVETLAPSGESIYSVRIVGEGRKLLSIKGSDTDPVIIDIRSNSKEVIMWYDFIEEAEEVYLKTVAGKEGWEKLYGEQFPAKEEPKNTSVAPVQPKKDRKVTKAKVEKPVKPHKDSVESKSEGMAAGVPEEQKEETADIHPEKPEIPHKDSMKVKNETRLEEQGLEAEGDDLASEEVSKSELVDRIESTWNELFDSVHEMMAFNCMDKDTTKKAYSRAIDMAAAIEKLMIFMNM